MFKILKKQRFLMLHQELILSWLAFLIAQNEQHETLLETQSLSLTLRSLDWKRLFKLLLECLKN